MAERSRNYIHPGKIARELTPSELKGARVMLINMPLRESALPNVAPLGPALLAARLSQFGVEAALVDLNAYRIPTLDVRRSTFDNSSRRNPETGRHLTFDEAEALICRYIVKYGEPDLVAFSGLITTLRWQENVAGIVRKLLPRTIIASGNGLATEFREDLFRWIPELNAVCHSEGDDAILKMAFDAKTIRTMGLNAAVESGKLAPYFLGMGPGGQPRFAYDGGRPADLDDLPFPAWDLLEEDPDGVRLLDSYLENPIWGVGASNSSAAPFSMRRSLSTVSSRGCPFACTFCFRGAQGERNYGVRSANNLAREIELFAGRYGIDFMGITDDNFMVVPARIRDLVPAMKEVLARTNVRWGTHGRLDEAADLRPPGAACRLPPAASRVENMAEAGCVYIGFGAESASPAVLKAMGKGGFILSNGATRVNGHAFPTTMMEGVRRTRDVGIHGNCTWIMGYPGETLHDLQTTVGFIKWQEELHTSGLLPGSDAYRAAQGGVNKAMFTATAYPGTDMFQEPIVREILTREFGIRFDRETGRPHADDALHYYVLELDDATKVLRNRDGVPLNFSAMPMDVFLEARRLADTGPLFEILNL